MAIADEHSIFAFAENVAPQGTGEESPKRLPSEDQARAQSRWRVALNVVHAVKLGRDLNLRLSSD